MGPALSYIRGVTNQASREPSAPTASAGRRWLTRRSAASLGLVSTAAAALLLTREAWRPMLQPNIALDDGDVMLIADFENLSGEEQFDACLDAALTVALAQSRQLDVLPRRRVAAALARIDKPGDTVVDLALARELAMHEGLRLIAAGRIDRRGSGYGLMLRLVEPASGHELSSHTAAAAGPDQVLEAVDALALGLRRRLGEVALPQSEPRLPLAQVSTASLPALKLYARSQRLRQAEERRGDEWLRQALVLDEDFALAMSALAWRLYQQSDRANRAEGDRLFARAQSLPQRLTLRERLWLVPLADDARGRREEAVAGYRAFLAQYPRDRAAWFRLGWTYMAALGNYESAAEVFRQLTQIDPRNAGALINLATCQQGMRQYEEAIASYHRAFSLSPDFQTAMYVNAGYGGTLVRLGRWDDARDTFAKMQAMPDALSRARGLRSMAFLLMHQGRYHEAIAKLGEAIEINAASHEPVSLFRDHVIRAGAWLALGVRREVQRELTTVNAIIAQRSLAPAWLVKVVKLRARQGDIAEVRRLVSLMEATLGNAESDAGIEDSRSKAGGYLDLARSELELLGGHATRAIAHANVAAQRLDVKAVLGSWARALQRAGRLEDAATKYQQLIDSAPFGDEEQEEGAMALVALASIGEQLGHRAQARMLYETLAQRWRDGDADLPLLKKARARLAAL